MNNPFKIGDYVENWGGDYFLVMDVKGKEVLVCWIGKKEQKEQRWYLWRFFEKLTKAKTHSLKLLLFGNE